MRETGGNGARAWALAGVGMLALALAACVTAPPRAIVRTTPGLRPSGAAVLVLPTRCVVVDDDAYVCDPSVYEKQNGVLPGTPHEFAPLIDPVLQLKLELAGYTLAAAAAMRVTTGDRIDTQVTDIRDHAPGTSSTDVTITPGTPLLDLSPPDLVAVAQSLHLAAIVTSTLRITKAKYGGRQLELSVAMQGLDQREPIWAVTCSQRFLGSTETSAMLVRICSSTDIDAASE